MIAERFPEFWAVGEGRQYALHTPFRMIAADVAALRAAAADAWSALRALAPVLQAMDDDGLDALAVPRIARRAVRLPYEREPSVVARFDFARCADGSYRVLECNADTPFLAWEAFAIGGAVCEENGADDPNAGEADRLGAALARAVGDAETVAAAAINAYREDWFTSEFFAACAERALARPVLRVPLHDLRMRNGLLVAPGGRRIDALLRQYPLEHFAADAPAAAFFDAVAHGRLRLVNPPAALLVQTKAALAIAWGLAERGLVVTDDVRAAIRRTWLPTYADLPDDGEAYVAKPMLGREGGGVRFVTGGDATASEEAMVYQRRVALPLVDYVLADGTPQRDHAIHTCFVVDGVPSAVAIRVGAAITDAHARFLPIGIAP